MTSDLGTLGTLVPFLARMKRMEQRKGDPTGGPVLPRPQPLTAPERNYSAGIKQLLADLPRVVRERVLPRVAEIADERPDQPPSGTPSSGTSNRDGALEWRADADTDEDRARDIVQSARDAFDIPDTLAERTASRAAQGAREFGRTELVRQTRIARIDPIGSENGVEEKLRTAVRENVRLIKSVPERFFDELETELVEGVRAGRTASTIAERLQSRFASQADDDGALAKAMRRADGIARDQVGKLHGELTRIRHENIGVRRYRWRTALDERVRGNPAGRYPKARPSHHAREGRIFEYDNPPEGGHPGEAPNCFPPSTRVAVVGDVRGVLRRPYSGPATTIITEDGFRLEGTPNHPILTRRGWIALGEIQLGDEVARVRLESRGGAGAQNHDEPACTLADLFKALPGQRLAVLGGEFYGEIVHDKIDIVAVDSDLAINPKPGSDKDREQVIFKRSDAGLRDLLQSCCVPKPILAAANHAASSFRMLNSRLSRTLGELRAFFAGERGHPQNVGDAACARSDGAFRQNAADNDAFKIVLSRDSEFAHSGKVVADDSGFVRTANDVPGFLSALDREAPIAERLAEIVAIDPELSCDIDEHRSVRRLVEFHRVAEKFFGEYSGTHVLTMQTSVGWYYAEGFLVRNCRCVAEPLLEDILEGTGIAETDGEPVFEFDPLGPLEVAAGARIPDVIKAGRR